MTITGTHRTPLTYARTLATVVAAGALLGAPASGLASKPAGKQRPAGKAAKGCAKTHNVGYIVAGTLTSFTTDDPATTEVEATTVQLTLTAANRHARRSGDIVDQDAAKKGVQAKGFVYTVAAGDAFKLALHGYEGADTPSPGDMVAVIGRVPLTKARCAPEGTSVADRYGAVDVRRVLILDRDAD
jgi:hypothetical protein